MKATLEIDALRAALGRLPAVKAGANPILQHALAEVTAEGDCLALTVSDLQLTETVLVACEAGTEGAATLPARQLRASLEGLRGVVTLTLDKAVMRVGHENGVGKRTFRLPTLPAQDFPRSERAEARRVDTDPAALGEAMGRVVYAAATNDVRFYLQSVSIQRGRVAASDGHRAARVPFAHWPGPDLIVPQESVAVLRQALAAPSAAVWAYGSESHPTALEVVHAGGAVRTQLIDGRYPDIDRVVPREADMEHRADCNTGEAIACLRRVKGLAEAIDKSRRVDLSMDPAAGVVRAQVSHRQTPEGAEDAFAATCTRAFEPTVNIDYLLAALAACGEACTIGWGGGPSDPLLLWSDGREDRHVVMPMRR